MIARRWSLGVALSLGLSSGFSLVGCAGLFDKSPPPHVTCRSDLDCANTEVCFVDGCGDPGKNIAVEVTPSARNGAYPQDFALDGLKATQTFRLYAPSQLQGALLRDQDSGGPLPYDGPVSLVLSGQSTIIPGLSRHFEATLNTAQTLATGTYSLAVGSGVYAISATPSDPLLPPLFEASHEVTPGQSEHIDLVFPSTGALAQLSGTVVRSLGQPSSDALQIQAFDPDGAPRSQPAVLGSDGSFTLSVTQETLALQSLNLRVSPVDPQALLPTKIFPVAPVDPLAPLELGDFGAPLTLTSKVVDGSGKAISGAAVHLEGSVIGGGTFQSAVALTADDGTFQLQTLASATPGSLVLFAVPPATSASGILVDQTLAVDGLTPLPVTLVCPDKVQLTGSVLTPDSTPAVGVKVTAVPVAALDPKNLSAPLPSAGGDATTDGTGAFSLLLDPGQYRLDFVPSTKLPRLSRFVDVTPDDAQTPGNSLVEVPPFTLSHGRSATGHVEILAADGNTADVAALARVRFYRQVDNGDTPSSVLLDQAYADANGDFTVLLPTR